ncbi:MAG: mechanosensitive ion channel family protein [Myxococcota bacterium]
MEPAQEHIQKFTSVTESLLGAFQDKLIRWLETFFSMLPNIVVALLVVAIFLLVSRWFGVGARRLLLKTTNNRPISDLLGSVTRLSVFLLGLFIALGLLNLDKTVTSLIAGLGVLGIALGFAFQDIASNFMAGVMMAVRRPFDVDDTVEIAGKVGRVKKIEMRATVVQTLDGLVVTLPNKDVFQKPIVNYTSTPERRMELQVGVAYNSDLEAVRKLVLEVGQDTPMRDLTREPEVFFQEFGDSSINLVLLVWLNRGDEGSYQSARSATLIRLKRRFDRAGIVIPFPIRTLDFGASEVGGVALKPGTEGLTQG